VAEYAHVVDPQQNKGKKQNKHKSPNHDKLTRTEQNKSSRLALVIKQIVEQ
jgi:hypothetical protein